MKHDSYNGSTSTKVLFCITRAYQAKLPAWSEPMTSRVNSTPTYSLPFNSAPTMPNEHVPSESPQRPLVLDGFKF